MIDEQQTIEKIKVTVDPPELKVQMGGAIKYHEYRIHGSDNMGKFDVLRRYSDFIPLKKCLQNRWPGVYIPSLPQKKFIGNSDKSFVQIRRKGLQNFFKFISQQIYLWQSQEFQLFIKSRSNQIQKNINQLPQCTNKQILVKYRSKFIKSIQYMNNAQVIEQFSTKIGDLKVYLKNAQIALQKMAKMSGVMSSTRVRFNKSYGQLLNHMLRNYQQKCVVQYSDDDKQNFWFLHSDINGLAECSRHFIRYTKTNSLALINQMIKQQLREIDNFEQILNDKYQYEQNKLKSMFKVKDLQLQLVNMSSGKQNLLDRLKTKTRQQQQISLTNELQKQKQKLKDLQQLCTIIQKIISFDQIRIFKSTRQFNYYHVIKQMIKSQKQIAFIDLEYWGKVVGQKTQIVTGKSNCRSKIKKSNLKKNADKELINNVDDGELKKQLKADKKQEEEKQEEKEEQSESEESANQPTKQV